MGEVFSVAIIFIATNCLVERQIYKIVLKTNWKEAEKTGSIPFEEVDLKNRGVIHLVFWNQIKDKVEKYYSGKEVVILEMDEDILNDYDFELKVESDHPDGDLYPYLYHKRQPTLMPSDAVRHLILK